VRRATSKPGVLYLHVFDWPSTGELKVSAFGRTVKGAKLLASPRAQASVSATADGMSPRRRPIRMASGFALQLQ
jgi:hypothetical protein